VHTGRRVAVQAALPADWEDAWHHVAGTYDGARLALRIDGVEAGSAAQAGPIADSPFPVNVGRNAALHGHEHAGELANARFDRVRLYARALNPDELAAESEALRREALLWLDFESVEEHGEYFSLGIGGRSYGVIWPDRRPQPELWQLKKSAQPVGIEPVEPAAGRLRVVNRFAFTDLETLDTRWELTRDGVVTHEGALDVALPPGEATTLELPLPSDPVEPGVEQRLRLRFQLKHDTPWAPREHEVSWEEFPLASRAPAPALLDVAGMPPLELEHGATRIVVRGADFAYAFDATSGALASLMFRGTELLRRGPQMNVWRAPLANERDDWGTSRGKLRTARAGMGNDVANGWRALGFDRLTQRVDGVDVRRTGPAEVVVEVRGYALSAAVPATAFASGFDVAYTYRIFGSGDAVLTSAVVPEDVMPEWLPKAGLELVLAPGFEDLTWYGRGPHETYPDRKTGARFGVYRGTLRDDQPPYLVPQDYGNKSDVRWIALERADGIGLFASGERPLEVSARGVSTDNLSRALYPPQLVPQDGVTLNLDHLMSGVGGTAISVLRRYQVPPEPWTYSVRLRPYAVGEETPESLYRQRSTD
jgi:beta-galactosidase